MNRPERNICYNKFMKTFLYFVAFAIAGIIVAILVTGYFVSEDYSGEESMVIDYEARNVRAVLLEVEKMHEGKRDAVSVEVLGKYLNLYAWVEHLKDGGYRRYRQLKKERDLIVFEMTESSYGVSGIWEFLISEEGGKTKITIKEDSKNTSLFHRGLYFYLGRNKETKDWQKFIRVRLFSRLLTTP
jgi:hypothetical protein